MAAPDGSVVLDLKNRLPGRGVWVSASQNDVRHAATKKLFARTLSGATPADGFADQVAAQIRQSTLSALSMARKAGSLVTGFDQVATAIRDGKVAVVIHAAEAADDGVDKLAGALARHQQRAMPVRVVRHLTEPELSLALGRSHVIHAAVLAGRASRHALDEIERLARFFSDGPGGDAPHLHAMSGPDRRTES